MKDPAAITRERAVELCMLARTQGMFTERLAHGARIHIVWMSVEGRAVVSFVSAGGEAQSLALTDNDLVVAGLWQAIQERAAWLSKPAAQKQESTHAE